MTRSKKRREGALREFRFVNAAHIQHEASANSLETLKATLCQNTLHSYACIISVDLTYKNPSFGMEACETMEVLLHLFMTAVTNMLVESENVRSENKISLE